MEAFIPTTAPCLRPRLHPRSRASLAHAPRPRIARRGARAALQPDGDGSPRPGFARDDDDPTTQPRRTFFPEKDAAAAAAARGPQSPNERVLAQVQATMRELGVEENYEPAEPRPFRPVDISRVNPLSALAGSAGAAAISATAWRLLDFVIKYALAHQAQVDDQIYVVQRITIVVRTALVCIFALASGISGVTALGLLLLAGRTAYAAVTGEFRDKDDKSEPASD